jgi:hypothetical protein
MGPGGEPQYHVSQLQPVMEEIRDLGARANAAGIREKYVAALETMMAKLQTEPLAWGDPLYHPKKPGSVVCQGVADPLIAHYAVYGPEREVVILHIDFLMSQPS